MRFAYAGILLALVVVAPACTEGAGETAEATLVQAGNVVSVGDPIHARVPGLMDTVALGGPHGLVLSGDRLFVSEATGHQIAIFDATLEFQGRISRPGGGPGELERPGWLAMTPEGNLAVRDQGNGRISVFSLAGQFMTSRPAPGTAGQFAPLSGDRFVAARSMDDSKPFSLIDSEGEHEFGGDNYPATPLFFGSSVILVEDGDGTNKLAHLTDTGLLQVMDTMGTTVSSHPVPTEVLEALNARRDEIARVFPGVVSQPLIKQMEPVPGRGIFLLIPLQDNPLLFFDLTTLEWVAVAVSDWEPTRYLVANATSIAAADDRLFVATGEQLHVLPITWPNDQ